jgi:hypothetical protein
MSSRGEEFREFAPDQIWNVIYQTRTGQKNSEIAMRKAAGARTGPQVKKRPLVSFTRAK